MAKTTVKETTTTKHSATLTDAGKKLVAKKAATPRKASTKIGEPVIVRPEEEREKEAKKAAAKVVKTPARKNSTPALKPEDYTTIIKDGLATAVPKSTLKDDKSKDDKPKLPAISKEDKERYAECVLTFQTAWNESQKTVLKAAFALYEINVHGLYRVGGFKNMTEFGQKVFGLSKSTTYNLIDIVDRFGAKIEAGKPVTEIAEKYSGYSQSQLGVMVGHTDDELAAITPDMSVRDIKAALKKSKPEEETAKKEEERDAKGKSGLDDQTPSEPEFRANLIHEFNKVEEWDAMRDPADELDFASLCNTIRHCLSKGHTVRIMDCFTVTNER